MLSCIEEGMCVGVGVFMFWQILTSISLYVWFLESFDYIYIYIYIFAITLLLYEEVDMFNEV